MGGFFQKEVIQLQSFIFVLSSVESKFSSFQYREKDEFVIDFFASYSVKNIDSKSRFDYPKNSNPAGVLSKFSFLQSPSSEYRPCLFSNRIPANLGQ